MKKIFVSLIFIFSFICSNFVAAETLKYSAQGSCSQFLLKNESTAYYYSKSQYFYSGDDVCKITKFKVKQSTVTACTKTMTAKIFPGIGWETSTTTKNNICLSDSILPVTNATSTFTFDNCILERDHYYTVTLEASSAGSCTTNTLCALTPNVKNKTGEYDNFLYQSAILHIEPDSQYINLYSSMASELYFDETYICQEQCDPGQSATSTLDIDFDQIKNISLVVGRTDKSDGSNQISYFYSPILLYVYILSILLVCLIVVIIFLKIFKNK